MVAVKRIVHGTNIDREVELHIKCDAHENIVRYLCKEKDSMGDTYLALQLCLGTLDDYVTNEKILGLVDRKPVELLQDATRGLSHLHKMGIVHRDVKPKNILISLPESGVVKAMVSDFGFSKKLKEGSSESFSVSSSNCGTLRWMAPEILGNPVKATKSVDVYALGWVFYFTLTKKVPFEGQTDIQIMQNVNNRQSDKMCLLANLGRNYTASNLIQLMTNQRVKARPPAEAVLKHPFFWDEIKKLNFIEVANNHLHSNKVLEDDTPCFLELGYTNWGTEVVHHNRELEPVMDYLLTPLSHIKIKPYNFISHRDLCRAIRNLSHHLPDSPMEVQNAIGGNAPQNLGVGAFPRSHSEIFGPNVARLEQGVVLKVGEIPETARPRLLPQVVGDKWINPI